MVTQGEEYDADRKGTEDIGIGIGAVSIFKAGPMLLSIQ